MRGSLVGLVLVGALAASRGASANGRFPATTNVRFQAGNNQRILLGATFGLLMSEDDGSTFHWVCEDAVGYSGTYDPDYAIAENGDIYAPSFEGLKVSKDGGCTWDKLGAPLDETRYLSALDIGPDGRIWAVTSDGQKINDVYVLTDGSTFEPDGLSEMVWWLSVETTPADANRIYVSGYQPEVRDDQGNVVTPYAALMRRRTTSGGPWETLEVTNVDFGLARPFFYLLGVSPTNEDVVYARAYGVNPPIGDALYRSADGGVSWEKIVDMAGSISAFTITSDGNTVIVGSQVPCIGEPSDAPKGCVRISTSGGAPGTFTAPTTEPQMGCVGERSDGTLFACGANYDPDHFGLGRSSDGQTWDPVFVFDQFTGDTAQPMDCPADSVQETTCLSTNWPTLLCSTLQLDLPMCQLADAGPDETDGGGGGGCCRVSGGGSAASATPALLTALVLLFWSRRRRTKS